jgi:predicted DNA-binding transcriptional regulator YafY
VHREHRSVTSRTESGRAASARIVAKLREALSPGVPKTYAELAAAGACSERSVRNYLDLAERTLGFGVQRVRGADGVTRVRAEASAAQSVDELAHGLAGAMLRGIFPTEGTQLDRRLRAPRVQFVVAPAGAYEYGEAHLRLLRRWIELVARRPRVQVRFAYRSPTVDGDRGAAVRVVWPLGVVFRDLSRVYLAGLRDEEDEVRDLRTYALERVEGGLEVLTTTDVPKVVETARIEAAIDLPFSMFRADGDPCHVHVRVAKESAPYVEGRRWHKSQRITRRKDGTLDVRFGPADAHQAAAWVRQWGKSVEVVGDARLREVMGK